MNGSTMTAAPCKGQEATWQNEIDTLVARAQKAASQFLNLGQADVDRIVRAAALAGEVERLWLARLAVEETAMGIFENKVTKNQFATEYIYNNIKDVKTVGVLRRDPSGGIVEMAEPVGPIAAITPVTNPTSTAMFKCIIALKTRNPVIVAPHPKALRCSIKAARTVYEAALKAGAPRHAIQWVAAFLVSQATS
jgi:acetaldehyde dehydrogenase/alcohol dehydrogenase